MNAHPVTFDDISAVEPALFDDTRRSFDAGERIGNPIGQHTICDAIMTPIPNDVAFQINLDLLARGVTASDAGVRAAMRFAFEHFKVVTKTGAVVGLAAILGGQVDIKDRTIMTIITGGNIDNVRFAALLGENS